MTTNEQFDEFVTRILREGAGRDDITARQLKNGEWEIRDAGGLRRMSTHCVAMLNVMLKSALEESRVLPRIA